MNCNTAHTQFDDLLDGSLTLVQVELLQQHLHVCPDCRQALQQEQAFRQLMRSHPVPPASPGFAARALRCTSRQHKSRSHQGFVKGFSSAMAAGLVLWVAAAVFLPGTQQTESLQNVKLVLNESRTVSLVFNVPHELVDATLSMQLPAHVELVGYPGQHQLTWKTKLRQGKNVLSLPIVAHHLKPGELVSKVSYGGEEKTFRLKLQVQDLPGHQQSRIDSGLV